MSAESLSSPIRWGVTDMGALSCIVVGLWCITLFARLCESPAARDAYAELRRIWRGSGIPGRAVAIALIVFCASSGGSKGISPVSKLFGLLFWHPASPWQLAAPAEHVGTAAAAVATANAELSAVQSVTSSNEVVTLSFDWHAPSRLPYHAAQNVLAWTARVSPTNINGTLYEDHYVAFNAQASTNPAVILIEYARSRADGTVERYSAEVVTNSFPQQSVINVQSGSHTCYWFRCAVPLAFTNEVRDWNGEALFGAPEGSGKGFDLLGTLVIDAGSEVWVGATTNALIEGSECEFRNGINVTQEPPE